MKWRAFFFTRLFWRHLMLAAVVSVILMWITLQIISVFTHHGEKIQLPDFVDQPLESALEFADQNGFSIVVMDSVYEPRKEKGTILIQDPLPETFVKEGRTIYVTVVGQTPGKVKMPNLLDLSIRQAVERVAAAGLELDFIQVVPGEYNNAVTAQLHQGKPIRAGRELDRNSKIVLVVEQAQESAPSVVPDLKGLDISDAYQAIFSATLNIGRVTFKDGLDELTSRVYKQNPSPGSSLTAGGSVDLWFKNND